MSWWALARRVCLCCDVANRCAVCTASDDDVPLAALAKSVKKPTRKRAAAKPRAKAAPKKRGAAKKAGAKKAASAKKATTTKRKASGGAGSAAKKKKPAKTPKKAVIKPVVSAAEGTVVEPQALNTTPEAPPLKEQVVGFILTRWWYCMDYPGKDYVPPEVSARTHCAATAGALAHALCAVGCNAQPAKHYIAMEGFPGISVGVYGDEIGNVVDARPKPTVRPTRDALLQLPSSQLKEMWQTGLKKQLEEIVAREGDDCVFAEMTRKEMQQVKLFAPAAADAAYKRALKAAS